MDQPRKLSGNVGPVPSNSACHHTPLPIPLAHGHLPRYNSCPTLWVWFCWVKTSDTRGGAIPLGSTSIRQPDNDLGSRYGRASSVSQPELRQGLSG